MTTSRGKRRNGLLGWVAFGLLSASIPLVVWMLRSDPSEFVSPPKEVRARAGERYEELTAPVASTGSPHDPVFATQCSPLTIDSRGKIETEITPAREEWVPDYEVVRFRAGEVMAVEDFDAELSWLATGVGKPIPEGEWGLTAMEVFRPDGSKVDPAEDEELGVRESERTARSISLAGYSSLTARLQLWNCPDPLVRLREVFDADTHVPLAVQTTQWIEGEWLTFAATMPVLHDASLLAVVDVAHGATRDYEVPLDVGQVVNDSELRLELIHLSRGKINGSSSDFRKANRIARSYSPSSRADGFGVIFRIDPPVMESAVSLEVLDGAGRVIGTNGRFFLDLVPVANFSADLAQAKTLRVRVRPKQTRLLLTIDRLPGMPNTAPEDLFDVVAPGLEFRDVVDLQRWVSAVTQLHYEHGSWNPADRAFPMTLEGVRPREVLERYLTIDGLRSVRLDADDRSLHFDQDPGPGLRERVVGWLQSHGWWLSP